MIAQWHIAEAKQNAPIPFDEANKRLFIICRDPGKLVVLDSSNGRSIASFPTGARADEVVFDHAHHRIYVASGEGKIFPYQEADADHYKASILSRARLARKRPCSIPSAAECLLLFHLARARRENTRILDRIARAQFAEKRNPNAIATRARNAVFTSEASRPMAPCGGNPPGFSARQIRTVSTLRCFFVAE